MPKNNFDIISPKKLFLIDGIGALISAFFLGVILVHFHDYFGMPLNVLSYLALIACLFSIYSISCVFLAVDNWKPLLKIISFANTLYAFLTLGIVIYYYQQLTILGFGYFIIELSIVFGLVNIEKKMIESL